MILRGMFHNFKMTGVIDHNPWVGVIFKLPFVRVQNLTGLKSALQGPSLGVRRATCSAACALSS